jgi:uncharacterized membrane protein (UPF0136 family)
MAGKSAMDAISQYQRDSPVMLNFRAFRLASLRKNIEAMLTVILFLAGLACFYLFFKSIDYFENI